MSTLGISKWPWIMAGLVCFVLGIFAGREHLKWEIKQAFTGVTGNVSKSLEDLKKDLPKQSESQKTHDEEKASPSSADQKASENPNEVKLGQSIKIEGVNFRPRVVELKKLKRIEYTFSGKKDIESKEELLVLSCDLENVSEGQIFSPIVDDGLKCSIVTDNFGNESRPERVGITTALRYEGQELRELKPGEILNSIIVCEKPKAENAQSFIWKVYLVTNNKMGINSFMPPEDKAVHVRFQKSDIR